MTKEFFVLCDAHPCFVMVAGPDSTVGRASASELTNTGTTDSEADTLTAVLWRPVKGKIYSLPILMAGV